VTACVDSIGSYIATGNPYIWNSGAGHGSQVFLRAMGRSGPLANLAPAAQAGGFPISTYNYNAGAVAFEFLGSAHAFQTPIPYGNGTIPALDVIGFQLEYNSTNGWFSSRHRSSSDTRLTATQACSPTDSPRVTQ
jgi:hypothetical protein